MDAHKLYFLAHKFHVKGHNFIAKQITKINNLMHNSYIPYTAEIGKGTIFGYGGIGVVVHAKSKIGSNCVIGQNVTIGGRTGHGGPPVIGDNVYIGPGARLLGGFTVGDNVVIGANAVVIKDIPSNCVAAGVPAKIISTNIDKWKKEGVI